MEVPLRRDHFCKFWTKRNMEQDFSIKREYEKSSE